MDFGMHKNGLCYIPSSRPNNSPLNDPAPGLHACDVKIFGEKDAEKSFFCFLMKFCDFHKAKPTSRKANAKAVGEELKAWMDSGQRNADY